MYKGFLVDRALLDKDPHFAQGCASCHKGNEGGADKASAHQSLVRRPSDDLAVCGACHEDIAKTYKTSLHYTTIGQRHGVIGRFSAESAKTFDAKVFPRACQSCHASCGDCHVKAPVIGGISIGLIKGHQFVKRDEGKTCAFCHGGRVYPEFTGEYGGSPDVHYQKGMICLDCHKKAELHGDGNTYASRHEVKGKPSCVACHKPGSEKAAKAETAHGQHVGKVGCAACHASAAYRNCADCHLWKGATSNPGFILGLSPKDKKTVTTLRLIPTVRDSFKPAGVEMENFDSIPNYWQTFPHNIRKRTERTRACEVCHEERQGFLTKDTLIKDGSKANESLIVTPKPLKK